MIRFLVVFFAAARTGLGANNSSYVGCYIDSEIRLLPDGLGQNPANSPEYCIDRCLKKGFKFAGPEAGDQCFCGNSLIGGTKVNDAQCNQPCAADNKLMCGAGWRLSVYRTPLSGVNWVKSYYVGCYIDSENRLLPEGFDLNPANSPEYCINRCLKKGFKFAGPEAGDQCFCGNSLRGGTKVNDAECNQPCAADNKRMCGAGWRLSVYRTPLSGVNWVQSHYVGCYIDGINRLLPSAFEYSLMITPEVCVNICKKKGFQLAGTEVGEQCFCGDTLKEGTKVKDSECNHACGGDYLLKCGYYWRLSVYKTSAVGTNWVQKNYLGCYIDSNERQLPGVFVRTELNTPEFCVNLCYKRGYKLAGTQARDQCFCGDTLREGTKVSDSECDRGCSGDDKLMCGGGWRLSVYKTSEVGVNRVKSNYIGCYTDSNDRQLPDISEVSQSNTPEFCVDLCYKKGFTLAGVEAFDHCYCGHMLKEETKVDDSECNIACSGDNLLVCGGQWRLSVYRTSAVGINKVKSNYVGCYIDSNDRQLPDFVRNKANTPESCVDICYKKGFSLAGVQAGDQCYCGDTLKEGTRVEENECSSPCTGDDLLMCGGIWRVGVYRTSALGRGFNPVSSNYVGCYRESNERQLNGATRSLKLLTPDSCVTFCKGQGYRLAGLVAGTECYCGDTLMESTKAKEEDCNKACGGDLTLKCGSDQRLSVYTTTENLRLGPSQYLGCFEEYSEDRLLSGDSVVSDIITVDFCVGFCYRRGFLFAGMQYGERCSCGNSLKQRQRAPYKECGLSCKGDKYQKCGGNWRISVYSTGLTHSDKRDSQLPTYMGCFKDSAERQFFGARKDSSALTPGLCSNFCYRKGFRLAGMEVGSECHCGDNLKEGTIVDDSECKSRCTGDKSTSCGWFWRLSVYRTSVPANRANTYYLGCFEESQTNKTLTGESKETEHMTIDHCVGFCYRRRYTYAGLQNGAKCFCGNTLMQREYKPLSQCNSMCFGDNTEFCGGNWRVSVYLTGIKRLVRPPVSNCQKSETILNGKPSCRGELIFNEDFDHGFVDLLKWSNTRFMPSLPDNEFVVFGDNPENVYSKNGILYIKPTLNDEVSLDDGLLAIKDCTGQLGGPECFREAKYFNILPPVQSARIHTKESFTFRYGTVEVRAKLPLGDWIVPELWLVPKENSYGPNYASGKIRFAMSRGNRRLNSKGTDIGNSKLEAGIMMGMNDNIKWKHVDWSTSEGWHKRFHNFTFKWTPDSFLFSVDGESERLLSTREQRLSELIGLQQEASLWRKGSNLAPFDEEFYISLGVAVGGTRDFPDESISEKKSKPWSDSDAKATLNFWIDKDNWYSTWNDEESALQIDYIKVTAL